MSYGGISINDWVEDITNWGKSKGWDKPALCKKKGIIARGLEQPPKGVDTAEVLAKVMLVVTELSEAVEEVREGRFETWQNGEKPEGFAIELADAVIRIFHIAGLLGLDLEAAIQQKMAYNRTRPRRHGGKRA